MLEKNRTIPTTTVEENLTKLFDNPSISDAVANCPNTSASKLIMEALVGANIVKKERAAKNLQKP